MLRSTFTLFLTLVLVTDAWLTATEPINIGSRLELFVDRFLVDTMIGLERRLHARQPREVAFHVDQAWEGPVAGYATVFQDRDRYRMYYSTIPMRGEHKDFPHFYREELCCYAESTDGIHRTKPELNLLVGDFKDRKRRTFTLPKGNNVVWLGQDWLIHTTHNFSPFLDTNPNCPPDRRYKAIGRCFWNPREKQFIVYDDKPVNPHVGGVVGFTSPDGIHWNPVNETMLFSDPGHTFDANNVVFWDCQSRTYVEYHRKYRNGFRDQRTSRSSRFDDWTRTRMEFLDYGAAPAEHHYSPKVNPYFRAPHIYLAWPM